MDLNRLIEFNTIAELGSFTKAAEQLGISTAVLSVRFSKFEEQIGQRLFDRSSRNVALTDAGQRFIADSRDIINEYMAAIRLSQSVASDYHLDLKLAVCGYSLPHRLIKILRELRNKYLNLHIALLDDPSWSDLLEGRIQFYLGCDEHPEDNRIRRSSFGRSRQYVIVPRSHRFALRTDLALKDLTGETLLLFPKTQIPGIRAEQERMLKEEGVSCAIVQEAVSKTYYCDYVSMGQAIAVLPFPFFPDALPPSLIAIPLDSFQTRINNYLFYLEDAYNPIQENILRQLDHPMGSIEDYGWGDPT